MKWRVRRGGLRYISTVNKIRHVLSLVVLFSFSLIVQYCQFFKAVRPTYIAHD